MRRLGFIPFFQPSASSFLNSSENVWARLKPVISKCIAENVRINKRLNDKYHLKPIVEMALEIVKERMTENIVYANARDIVKLLAIE